MSVRDHREIARNIDHRHLCPMPSPVPTTSLDGFSTKRRLEAVLAALCISFPKYCMTLDGIPVLGSTCSGGASRLCVPGLCAWHGTWSLHPSLVLELTSNTRECAARRFSDRFCVPTWSKIDVPSEYQRYFQHTHFIPIVGVGKRGEY